MSTPALFSVPKPCNFAPENIEELAERVARDAKLPPDGNLEEFVRLLGGHVYTAPTPTTALIVRSAGDFDLTVSSDEFTSRHRFLVARGVGFYFLHFPLVSKGNGMMVPWHMDDAVDREACTFAGVLLVPGPQFRLAFDEQHGILVDVAERFGTETDLVRRRAQRLQLIPA